MPPKPVGKNNVNLKVNKAAQLLSSRGASKGGIAKALKYYKKKGMLDRAAIQQYKMLERPDPFGHRMLNRAGIYG